MMIPVKHNMPHNSSVVRYSGGKSYLADKIIPLLPTHTRYVEPFFGGGSVFFRKPACRFEVVNDLDSAVTDFFRCVRDHVDALTMQLLLTPVSRAEFHGALAATKGVSLVERARNFFIIHNQGFAGSGGGHGDWTIGDGHYRGLARGVSSWQSGIALLAGVSQRLRNTIIDNREAIDAIEYYRQFTDPHETLMYVDPPYMHSTRKDSDMYAHEMTDSQHETLLQLLVQSPMMIALSGYDCAMYRDLLTDWHLTQWDVPIHSAGRTGKSKGKTVGRRVECLWRNPLAVQTMQGQLWK